MGGGADARSGRGIGGRTGGWAEGAVARGGWAAGWRPVREMSARGRRQVLGAPGPQGGQGAIGPRSFGRDGGLEVSLPGQPVLHDGAGAEDRKSTRLNSSHVAISYAVFCLKKS